MTGPGAGSRRNSSARPTSFPCPISAPRAAKRERACRGEIYFLSDGPATPRSIVIRPEDFQLVANGEGENIWPARLEQVIFLGAAYECRLGLSGATLRAQFPRSAALSAGRQICVQVDFRRCIPLEE